MSECIKAELSMDIIKKITQGNSDKILVVADVNTYNASGSGNILTEILQKCFINFSVYIYSEENLIPNEKAVGKLFTAISKDTSFIIGLGSGVINDLCRYCAFMLNIDYAIITTAASMDGYMSNVSPLIVNGLKTTYIAKEPAYVINDINILKSPPRIMTAAGVGDIYGKATCSIDWKLSNILFNEEYSDAIASMTAEAVEICINNLDDIAKETVAGINAVIDALTISGKAMSLMGNSRPASGAEHHIAHFWEMNFLFENKPPVLHGIKVGIATLTVLQIFNMLINETPNFEKCRNMARNVSMLEYENTMKKVYRHASKAIIENERKSQRLSENFIISRINTYEVNWHRIVEVIKENLPEFSKIESGLKLVGCPISPIEIGIDNELYRSGIVYAKELRSRFTVLQILSDLCLIETYADILTNHYYKK